MDLLMSLSSLYFRHIHPWFPFLDPRRIMGELGSMEEGSLIHHALFGISLPFSYDSRLGTLSSDSFWKYSKRKILLEVLEEPSYSSLEALAVLSLDISGMTNGAQVWGPLAAAIRLATQLKPAGFRNLRATAEQDPRLASSGQDQISKDQLFWAIYALDCYVSITTNHGSQLLPQDIEQFMSSRTFAWQGSEAYLQTETGDQRGLTTIDPQYIFGHHLQTLDQSRQVHNIHIALISLNGATAIDEWIDEALSCSAQLFDASANLPRILQLETALDASNVPARCLPPLLMLHAYSCALIIHLHSLLTCSSLQGGPRLNAIRDQCHEYCLQAVANLESIVSQIGSGTLSQLGWPFAWCLWTALRYLLVRQYHAVMPVSRVWDMLLKQLKAIAKYWQIANKYSRMLEQVRNELQQGMSDSVPTPSRFLLSFVDFRNSAADLEDQSRVDPVLHQRDDAAEQSTPLDATFYDYQNLVSRDPAPETPVFSTGMLQESETWYNLPLFATSAYQQVSRPLFSNTERYM